MPVRWWGIVKSLGIFSIGTVTGTVIGLFANSRHILLTTKNGLDNTNKKLKEDLAQSIASDRRHIEELEAKGDSESWEKAQDLKIELNKKETRKAELHETNSRSKNKSFDWSYQGSASASFEFPSSKPKNDAETRIMDKIVEDLYQNKIHELEANGDLLSMNRAEDIKTRLRHLKARHASARYTDPLPQRD